LKTYEAGRTRADRATQDPGTREWVFPLLATRRHRDHIALLSALELRRRPDCEPTLRALVTGEWTPETVHHIGWCETCRTAGFALGMGTPAAARAIAAPIRRRAVWVGVATGAVLAATAVGAQSIDNPFAGSPAAARGGVAHIAGPAAPASPAQPASGSTGSTGSSGSGSTAPGGPIVPVPRARPAIHPSRSHHSQFVVPAARGSRAQLPLTT
jgi:hypothetical protein